MVCSQVEIEIFALIPHMLGDTNVAGDCEYVWAAMGTHVFVVAPFVSGVWCVCIMMGNSIHIECSKAV